jgi:hypothetical protein
VQTCEGMEVYLCKFLTYDTGWNCVVSFTRRPLYTASKWLSILLVGGWVDIDFEPWGSNKSKAQNRNLRARSHSLPSHRRVPHHRLSWEKKLLSRSLSTQQIYILVRVNNSRYKYSYKRKRIETNKHKHSKQFFNSNYNTYFDLRRIHYEISLTQQTITPWPSTLFSNQQTERNKTN